MTLQTLNCFIFCDVGRPWRVTAAPRFKPWDSPHRYDYDEEDREFWEEQDGAMKEKYQNSRYGTHKDNSNQSICDK